MRPAAVLRTGPVLGVLSAGAFMASLDVFIVNVAFVDIRTDFAGTTVSDVSWVLNAYTILYAALLVPFGRLADRYGRKGAMLVGLALFTAASAACALSAGIWWLVAFRSVQAGGAALLTPAGLGLVVACAPPGQRARWVRIWAVTGALAAALGPALGGLLVEASWRWVFVVNVPVGVIALLVAARYVPRSVDDAPSGIPDPIDIGLLVVGVGALSLALVEGPDWGWSSGRVIIAFVLAAVASAGFVVRSARVPQPVVDRALLRVRTFVWGNVTAVLFSVPFAALLLTIVLWMQDVWHFSALRTGLGIAPGPLMVPVFATLAQRSAARVPVGFLVATGCVLFALGSLFVLLRVDPDGNYATSILPGWVVAGVGVGLALPSIVGAATADLRSDQSATGSAVVTMNRQLGTALGVAVAVAILGSPHGYLASRAAYDRVWWTITALAALAVLPALAMTSRSPGAREGA